MREDTGLSWIAFDAVGTLIHADPPVADVYHVIGRRHGSQLARAEVARRFRKVLGLRSRSAVPTCSEIGELEFWRSVVADVLPDVMDARACFQELHDWFARPSAWTCYADAAPALTTLAQHGYRLALASNFDARLHSVRRGLTELAPIDACVVSSEAGWRKPHAGFFERLASTCGCPPQQILMVGDDLDADVRAAEAALLRAVLLDRDRASGTPAPHKLTIGSLSELPRLVERL